MTHPLIDLCPWLGMTPEMTETLTKLAQLWHDADDAWELDGNGDAWEDLVNSMVYLVIQLPTIDGHGFTTDPCGDYLINKGMGLTWHIQTGELIEGSLPPSNGTAS